MSDPYHHGVTFTEATEGVRPMPTVDTSTIGLVTVADDADDDVFPAGENVLITDVRAAVAKAGDGPFAQYLEAIAAQTSPSLNVIRAVTGAGEGAEAIAAATKANIIAAIGKLRLAEQVHGRRPRILGAPGHESEEVVAALVAEAKKLRGMVYAGCAEADTVAEAVTYRGEFGARELVLHYGDFKSGSSTRSATAVALGLRARIDEEIGWHKTLSNVAVNGVTGVTFPVSFDLQDDDTDAGTLNAAQVQALIRRNGYRFWGNKTCADDPMFEFESAVRTAQVLRDTAAEGFFPYMDQPMTPGLARDILEALNAKIRGFRGAGRLIGGEYTLNAELNTTTELASGKLHIRCRYTPVPPLDNPNIRQEITDDYFVDFLAQAAA